VTYGPVSCLKATLDGRWYTSRAFPPAAGTSFNYLPRHCTDAAAPVPGDLCMDIIESVMF